MLVALLAAGAGDFGPLDLEFWVLAVFVLLGELFPIQVHGQVGEETFSTPFGFALLLIYGVPEVALVQVASSLTADLIRRRPADRVLFNLAQLTVSWAVAGAVLALAGGTSMSSGAPLEARDLPAIAAAALAFFAVNSTVVRTAEALLQRTSIVGHLRAELLFRGWSAATLFALGPPVAVVAEDWLYLVPAFALPIAAVHRASKQASEMEHLALHDSLTELPNRTLLSQRAARAITDAADGRHAAALLTIDLDRFRDVNDTFGRAQGDALLVEVAAAARKDGARRRHGGAHRGRQVRGADRARGRPRRRRGSGPQHPRRAQPPARGRGRDVERGRDGRDRRLSRPRRPRGSAAPARRRRHVPREAGAVAARVLRARLRRAGAPPARARDRPEAGDRQPRGEAPLPAEARPRLASGGWSGGARALDGRRARGRFRRPRSCRSPSARGWPSPSPTSCSRWPLRTAATGGTRAVR